MQHDRVDARERAMPQRFRVTGGAQDARTSRCVASISRRDRVRATRHARARGRRLRQTLERSTSSLRRRAARRRSRRPARRARAASRRRSTDSALRARSLMLSATIIGTPSRLSSSTRRRLSRRLVASVTQTMKSGAALAGEPAEQHVAGDRFVERGRRQAVGTRQVEHAIAAPGVRPTNDLPCARR